MNAGQWIGTIMVLLGGFGLWVHLILADLKEREHDDG